MSDQPLDTPSYQRTAPLWNGWAIGMFLGLVALSAMFFGWRQTIHLSDRWSELSSQMQAVCRDQQLMAGTVDTLIHGQDEPGILGNDDLRALLPRLTPTRPYPAAEADLENVPPTQPEDSAPEEIERSSLLFVIELPTPRHYSCEALPDAVAPSIFDRAQGQPI